ncbi:MAG: CIA30 family protein [Verrucomicrobiia bacterium]
MINPVAATFLAAIASFSMHLEAAPNRLLLTLGELAAPSKWEVINDSVMGGISTSQMGGGKDGTLVFAGTVSLENNGGFASVRSLSTVRDLTGCDAFILRVRGDGRRYKFTVRTERSLDRAIYQAAFMTKEGEWQEHRLALKDFVPTFRGRVLLGEPPLDPAKAAAVGFLISDQQAGPFRLEIAWIKASMPTGP